MPGKNRPRVTQFLLVVRVEIKLSTRCKLESGIVVACNLFQKICRFDRKMELIAGKQPRLPCVPKYRKMLKYRKLSGRSVDNQFRSNVETAPEEVLFQWKISTHGRRRCFTGEGPGNLDSITECSLRSLQSEVLRNIEDLRHFDSYEQTSKLIPRGAKL